MATFGIALIITLLNQVIICSGLKDSNLEYPFQKFDHNYVDSGELKEKVKFEISRYQCWKSAHCKHDAAKVCGLDPHQMDNDKRFIVFKDECALFTYNCKHSTTYEISISMAECNKKSLFHSTEKRQNEAKPKVKKRNEEGQKLAFSPEPRIQIVRGRPNYYFI